MFKKLSYSASLTLLMLAGLFMTSSAYADLCTNCAGRMFITNIGKCVGCSAKTASGSFVLCPDCSKVKNQCEACRAVLPAVPAVAKPVAPRVETPVEPAVDKPAEPSMEKSAVTPAEKPAEPPVEKPVKKEKPAKIVTVTPAGTR